MTTSVAVIDYGMGNLHSVSKALEQMAKNQRVIVSSNPDEIAKADRIVFPGVGAIRDCMAEIKNRNLDELIKELAVQKPFLGICVGMQAMLTHSEENGGVDCLNILPGQVKRFEDNLVGTSPSDLGEKLKVPHMGWNQVEQNFSHPLWNNIKQNERCYFVHSYYAKADLDHEQAARVAANTHYGQLIDSALARDNIFAVQFHPEKSHRIGLQLLQNFLTWDGQGE